MINNFDELLNKSTTLGKKKVVVAAAHNEAALTAIADAFKLKLTDAVLVGDKNKLREFFEKNPEFPAEQFEIIDQPDNRKASEVSVKLLREKKADILLKGSADTSTLLREVLNSDYGLRTGRLLSDVFIFEFPDRKKNKLIMITDGGINLNPDLNQKIEIIQNAVEVAHKLGNNIPKVALLSAAETVNSNLISTVDASIISKMNQRGQIKGCLIDGPLALDNAVSKESAEEKGITSEVAGEADILVAPNIEAANTLAKSTTCFAKLRLGHVIVGAKAPILIPSRADKPDAKLLSIALGVLMCS